MNMIKQNKLTNILIDAVINNDIEAVLDLLNRGADPNGVLDEAEVTPLHYAAQNNALEVIPILIEAGADLNAMTVPDELTPLEVATLHGHTRIVQLILAYLNGNDSQH